MKTTIGMVFGLISSVGEKSFTIVFFFVRISEMCCFEMIPYFAVVLVLFVGKDVSGEDIRPEQQFRVKPQDVRVKEGNDVTLRCEIDNLAGRVQWTKDGMALGYDAAITGYPRYQYTGNFEKGVYNLQIKKVSLEDDAEFQCQVGPKRTISGTVIRAIRESANLTVLVPPSSVEILGYANNSKVDVREQENLKLQCLVRSSRPSAKVTWYREGELLKSESADEEKNCKPLNKTKIVTVCDVLSTLYVRPTKDDEAVNYSCVARHDALPGRMDLFSTVYLNILYPPGSPHIEGYIEDDPTYTLSAGRILELTCRSTGGNSLAQLRWFKNGFEVSREILYKISGKVSESKLDIKLKPDDNNAVYSCEASNSATVVPLKVDVKLSVAFGPGNIDLTGSNDAKAGENITLTCTAASSNPPADIQWVVDGQTTSSKILTHSPGVNGGLVTVSKLDIVIPSEKKELLVYCYGTNPRSSRTANATHTVHIYYSPGPPVIQGYPKGGFMFAGMRKELSCTSSGGNPLATLTWYKNGEKIETVTKKADHTSSFADIVISATNTDNGANYSCEAFNPSLKAPLVASVKLNVYFAPDNGTIRAENEELLHVGSITRLTCNASSSNPRAEITWLRNNIQITDGISQFSEPGPFGGELSSSQLTLNVTADMHKSIVTCRAYNSLAQKGVNMATQLNVSYKPIFMKPRHSSSVRLTEGDVFSVSYEAHANPPSITYYWTKDEKVVEKYARGSSLTIPKVKRDDAGVYTCEARNSEGSEKESVELNVQYEAGIANITKVVTVSSGANATLTCTVTGNPINPDNIWWINPDLPDLDKRSRKTFENDTLTMELDQVTIRDMGVFYCLVNNGIGAEKNDSALLIVEHAPIAEKSELIKVASNISSAARFICRGTGAPQLEFLWFKGDLLLNKTINYAIDSKKIDELHYESVLEVKQVVSTDYGKYYCLMKNTLGSTRVDFEMFSPSKPDSPSSLRIINVTQNSVVLSWSLDYDGGLPTNFCVRYFAANKGSEKPCRDVGNKTQSNISGLLPGVLYVFDVKAFNALGESDFSAVKVNATTVMATGSPRIVNLPVEGEGLILLVAAGIGVLLLLNILMILICAWRRSKKSGKGLSEPGNKSVEMYATASKNSNDMSSGTLSSLQSEKLNDDENDVSSAYVIEDINYPFFEKEAKEFYKSQFDGYSTVGHIHHLPPPVSSLNCCVNSHYAHTTTLPGRRRLSQISDFTNGSPTPSIPPPMSTISTNAYRSLQCNNYLHL